MNMQTDPRTWDENKCQYYLYRAEEDALVYEDGVKVSPTDLSQPIQVQTFSSNISGKGHAKRNSSAQTNAWTWDEIRGQYYIYVPAEDTYVYQNGVRVPRADPSQSVQVQAFTPSVAEEDLSDNESVSLPNLGGLNLGLNTHQKITGRRGGPDKEEFDPKYRVRIPPLDFFVVGKVFRVLWPEPLGNTTQDSSASAVGNAPSHVSQIIYKERVYAKIAWFVVQSQDRESSQCLRIQTYNNQGVAKRGIVKSDHAIIHTSSRPPEPTKGELPREEEEGMLKQIHVISKSRSEKLDVMSRINFRKIYTVEHNVKVYDFCDVDPKHINRLNRQHESVYVKYRRPPVIDTSDEDGGSDEDEPDFEPEDLEDGSEQPDAEDSFATPPYGLSMHKILVEQYVDYLHRKQKDELANALQHGQYWDQVGIYTSLMMERGVKPGDLVHEVLVQHYLRYIHTNSPNEQYETTLENSSPKEQVKMYGVLIKNRLPLPNWPV